MEMRRVSQFLKLVDSGGAFVENDKGGIDSSQIECGIWTPKSTEPSISGRGGVNGEQMNDSAAQSFNDMRDLLNQIAQFARGRDSGEAFIIQFFENFIAFFINCGECGFCVSEHPNESAIKCICCAISVRMNGNAEVGALRPMLPTALVHHVHFGFEVTRFSHWQLK